MSPDLRTPLHFLAGGGSALILVPGTLAHLPELAGVVPPEEAGMDMTVLHRSDAWRLVFSRGLSHVYRRTQQ